jgi:membrane protease YdiL (CAAX protease family)
MLQTQRRLGWFCHLLLLTAWILAITAASVGMIGRGHHPLSTVNGTLWRIGATTALFSAVCAAAWLFSRATASQWRLRWKGGLGPIWRGFLYSILVRVALAVITMLVALLLKASHQPETQIRSSLRPHFENVISLDALREDPAFAWLIITLASCYAGLNEEIWRGGVLAGFSGAFPRLCGGRGGVWVAVLLSSLLFGLAHVYMGWPAVGMTALIGVALGAITISRDSVWDAVMAHAFFDATSFAGMVWLARHFPQALAR